MTLSLIVTILCTTLSLLPVYGWDTSYDGSFRYTCPQNKTLYYFRSTHSNQREDRVWDFECRNLPGDISTEQCSWTGYVNSFDGPMASMCSHDKVVTGVYSYHSNRHEDRRYKFQCCRPSGHVMHSCSISGNANFWDGDMLYTVTGDRVVGGVLSFHNNHREDRIFRFITCSLQPVYVAPSPVTNNVGDTGTENEEELLMD